MKRISAFLVVLLLVSLSTIAQGNTNHAAIAAKHVEKMQADGSTAEVVKVLKNNGSICLTVGHIWRPGCSMAGCLVMHGEEKRHCLLCKTEQSRPEWNFPQEPVRFPSIPTRPSIGTTAATNLIFMTNGFATNYLPVLRGKWVVKTNLVFEFTE